MKTPLATLQKQARNRSPKRLARLKHALAAFELRRRLRQERWQAADDRIYALRMSQPRVTLQQAQNQARKITLSI